MLSNLSPSTKDRLRKLVPAIAAFTIVMIAATVFYSLTNRSSTVQVWAVGVNTPIAEDSTFDVGSLRTVRIPSDKALLDTSVAVGDNDFQGVFTALRDLPAGVVLSTTDFVPGEPLDETRLLVAESPNRMIVRIGVELLSVASPEVSIPSGNIQLVTDTIPPAHVACVQYLEDGSGLALIDPKDNAAIQMWDASGRLKTIQQTADQCPVGGTPRLCGILTTSYDPADVLTSEERSEGYVYLSQEDEIEDSTETSLPVFTLPACQVDNGAGVFDDPSKLNSEFCSRLGRDFVENILGVPLSRLNDCGNPQTARNPVGPSIEELEANLAANLAAIAETEEPGGETGQVLDVDGSPVLPGTPFAGSPEAEDIDGDGLPDDPSAPTPDTADAP